jgi:hypothetical protein
MFAPCTCHVPYSTTIFFIAFNHPCLIAVSRQIADFVVSNSIEEGA